MNLGWDGSACFVRADIRENIRGAMDSLVELSEPTHGYPLGPCTIEDKRNHETIVS